MLSGSLGCGFGKCGKNQTLAATFCRVKESSLQGVQPKNAVTLNRVRCVDSRPGTDADRARVPYSLFSWGATNNGSFRLIQSTGSDTMRWPCC